MTREEFFDQITDWYELIDFCLNNGYDDYCNDIYSEDSRDDEVCYELKERFDDSSWQRIRDYLNDLPEDYEYYRRDDYGDWHGLDVYDFRDRRDEIVEVLDGDGFWDDPEDEWDEDVDPEDLIPVPEESVSIFNMISGNKDMIIAESRTEDKQISVKDLLYA